MIKFLTPEKLKEIHDKNIAIPCGCIPCGGPQAREAYMKEKLKEFEVYWAEWKLAKEPKVNGG